MDVSSIQPPIEHKGLRWFLEFGVKWELPSLNSNYIQLLIALQIFGPCSYEDMVSYANFKAYNPAYEKHYFLRNKYPWTKFFTYYHLIKPIKRYRKGGRIFELDVNGEALLEWVLSQN